MMQGGLRSPLTTWSFMMWPAINSIFSICLRLSSLLWPHIEFAVVATYCIFVRLFSELPCKSYEDYHKISYFVCSYIQIGLIGHIYIYIYIYMGFPPKPGTLNLHTPHTLPTHSILRVLRPDLRGKYIFEKRIQNEKRKV